MWAGATVWAGHCIDAGRVSARAHTRCRQLQSIHHLLTERVKVGSGNRVAGGYNSARANHGCVDLQRIHHGMWANGATIGAGCWFVGFVVWCLVLLCIAMIVVCICGVCLLYYPVLSCVCFCVEWCVCVLLCCGYVYVALCSVFLCVVTTIKTKQQHTTQHNQTQPIWSKHHTTHKHTHNTNHKTPRTQQHNTTHHTQQHTTQHNKSQNTTQHTNTGQCT